MLSSLLGVYCMGGKMAKLSGLHVFKNSATYEMYICKKGECLAQDVAF